MDVLKEVANFTGSRGTLLEHSPVADSESNGYIERGIRPVEEMTRVILWTFHAEWEVPSWSTHLCFLGPSSTQQIF